MVRVGFPGGPRLEWYDRNPIPFCYNFYAPGEAPHAETERNSYTVPTGKKGFIMSAAVSAKRRTAPTTAGLFFAQIRAKGVRLITVQGGGGALGEGGDLAVGNCGVYLDGDTLATFTYDGSTGGTVAYAIGLMIEEIDA